MFMMAFRPQPTFVGLARPSRFMTETDNKARWTPIRSPHRISLTKCSDASIRSAVQEFKETKVAVEVFSGPSIAETLNAQGGIS